MSDKKTDKPEQQAEKKAATASKTDAKQTAGKNANEQATAAAAAKKTATAAEQKPAKSSSATVPVTIAALVVLAVVGGAFWYVHDAQQQFKRDVEQQLQTQLGSVRQSTQKIDGLGEQLNRSQSSLKQAQDRVALLEEQVSDLSQALQVMTDSGTELMLLNDVAHFIDLAQQQLLVGGNVSNAIIPLETAQARLVRSNRQGLALLLQAINGDLDRLRAVEKLDMSETLAELETLMTWLSDAPLLAPEEHKPDFLARTNEQPEPEASVRSAPADEEAPWWEEGVDLAQNWAQRAWQGMRDELSELVSVRRIDDATVLLMTPEQVQGLREHVRLRVSMAQLALMTRQNEIWQMELDTLMRLIEKRYDLADPLTQRALGLVRKLQGINVQPKLPSLDNTLAAVENLRQKAAQQAKTLEQKDIEAALKQAQEVLETAEPQSDGQPKENATADETQQNDTSDTTAKSNS